MAWELEGLIARLLMLISCAGEHGSSVQDLVRAIRDSLTPSCPSSQDAQDTPPDRAASEVWRWLVRRSDVSVGHGREHNHLSLTELLALPQLTFMASNGPQAKGDKGATQARKLIANGSASSPDNVVRVRTSEATMWEAITGHAVDHKRVPRSEWLLLLGIASSKADGILQGDLGRLVDQDKRSVPKRTDALVKKGYIVKRTTLIRGTKTSKMWLRSLVPPLPKESDLAEEIKADMNLSRQTLAEDLEPVPWRIRWTGQDIDYKALATTIMAVIKEWEVIRVRDLKGKLGVLGMRWQMKIVSKSCRFLNSRGVIQYVAAKLENRVFKDCVKFNRDMTAEDWSIYLSTGRRPGKPARGSEHMMSDGEDGNERLSMQRANNARLSMCPPWSLDKPLPQAIARAVQSLGEHGLSNPDIYMLTLGATFNRFLSSMTGSLSTTGIQPAHLEHLQIRSEHIRTGKVASYLFYLPPALVPAEAAALDQAERAASPENEDISASTGDSYGFLPAKAAPTYMSSSLDATCGLRRARKQERRETRRRGRGMDYEKQQPLEEGRPAEPDGDAAETLKTEAAMEETFETETSKPRTPDEQRTPRRSTRRLVTLKLRPESVHAAMMEKRLTSPPISSAQCQTRSSLETPGQVARINPLEGSESEPDSKEIEAPPSTRGGGRRGRPHGSGRGRGRARRPFPVRAAKPSPPRPWKCHKCGGSWKNHVGLKYHLEKSRTSCNPSNTASVLRSTRKGKEPSFFRPKASSPSDEVGSKSSAGSGTPYPDKHGFVLEELSKSPLIHSHGGDEHIAGQRGYAEQIPTLRIEQAADGCPELSATTIGAEHSRTLPSQATSGVLLQDEPILPRQILLLNSQHSRPDSPTPQGQGDVVDLTQVEQGVDATETVPVYDTMPTVQREPAELCHSNLLGKQITPNDAGGNTGNNKQNKKPRERICNLIHEILNEHNGVILGGKSLWHAVTAAWQTEVSDLPSPTSRACQAAIYSMIREKVVTEHWHAFRDRKGLFAKCQLILRPGIDAFSPESIYLVDVAKDAQSPPDEPSQEDDTDKADSQGKKSRARGRRLLAKEVAVLDAPVYAAQVAAKRAAEAAAGSPQRAKRAKYAARQKRRDEDGMAFSPEPRAPKSIGFPVSGLAKGHVGAGPGDPTDSLPFMQPATTVHFLEPNTYLLQDDSPLGRPEASPLPIDPQLTQAEPVPDLQQPSPTPIRRGAYVFDVIKPIVGSFGSWPDCDSDEFERLGTSFTLSGWVPDKKWLRWAAFGHEIEKRYAAREARSTLPASKNGPYHRFVNRVKACVEVEAAWKTDFANAVPGEAGPHNIFVPCFGEVGVGGEAFRLPLDLVWPPEGQLTLTPAHCNILKLQDEEESSLSGEESNPDHFVETKRPRLERGGIKFATIMGVKQLKRVALTTRVLTPLPARSESTGDPVEAIEDSAELMAAFIAVRSLLGGAEKAIDWGLLVNIFPNLGLTYLRKFWADARKEQAAYISSFTRVFQERLIKALDEEELPMIDFENTLKYDWDNLIQWTVQLPRQEGFQMPRSRESLTKQYSLKDVNATGEDWREKYFHVVSSFFARYEAVSSEPGAVTMDEVSRGFHDSPRVDGLAMARSWIKSLCSTAEAGYSTEQVKSKFLQLAARNQQQRSELLKEAAAQLAQQRVICRKEKLSARGRPYRLSEWYLSTLAKMAQSSKYDEAAAFKDGLDATFRRKKTMRVPYTLNDGAMMALTNLNATGRIRLVPVDVPDIPFGFEPGNYESRKTPKSYYHFALEAVPTATYEYNEDIKVLRDVVCEGPPRGKPQGESPQWIDIFGNINAKRWSELLGAFCFAFATRGSMTVEGICSALNPLLDEFEANLIVAWGKRTGVLTDLMDNVGTAVGVWWWLAVPWSRRRTNGPPGKSA